MTPPAEAEATEQIAWDLGHVLPATEGPEFEQILKQLEADVSDLEAKRGQLDDVASPEEVVALFNQLSDVREEMRRLGYYGSLAFSTDTSDQRTKAFMARMDDLTTDYSNRVRFLSLWWKRLPEERAEALTPEDPELRYYLERLREFAPHTLSEAEERVISIKDVTGGNALDNVREILTSGFRFTDPKTGEKVTQSELTRRVHDPDAEVREAAYKELWRVYRENESPLAYMYQTVVQDWANEVLKLRGYPTPISARHKANDVPDEVVDAMLEVCRENRGLFQRYFQWKGAELGLEPMSRLHVYAPLEKDMPEIPYAEARDLVLGTFDRFNAAVGREARKVFDEGHIHVFPDDNKRGGAYCATVQHRLTPYVFMNYTDDPNSVKTLAHEMGHAVHSLLAQPRHPLVGHAPLPLAETASVFAEMLLHDKLLAEADAETRRALISDKLSEMYATVMRQAYFTLFEKRAHEMLGEGATADDLHAAYLENLKEQFGPVEVPEAFKREWTYIPHFYASPFYCYAYSFGMLLSLALYGMYRERGEDFVPDYVELLATGGSKSPRDAVLESVGVDIADKAFWQKGFDVIAEMVDELEGA